MLAELPRELQVRILWQARRARAAEQIQAVWRGRDVRDWLECPCSREYNYKHPKYVSRRGCSACLAHNSRQFLIRKGVCNIENKPAAWAWLWRRPYIAYFYSPQGPLDPREIPFVSQEPSIYARRRARL